LREELNTGQLKREGKSKTGRMKRDGPSEKRGRVKRERAQVKKEGFVLI
jgi:hypothetical protein